jgi:hypothetical protein
MPGIGFVISGSHGGYGMSTVVYWVVTACSLVGCNKVSLKMETARSSETLMITASQSRGTTPTRGIIGFSMEFHFEQSSFFVVYFTTLSQ